MILLGAERSEESVLRGGVESTMECYGTTAFRCHATFFALLCSLHDIRIENIMLLCILHREGQGVPQLPLAMMADDIDMLLAPSH